MRRGLFFCVKILKCGTHRSSLLARRVLQPVDIVLLWTTSVDLLAPRIVRMRVDAMDGHDTRARLSASVTQSYRESLDSYSTDGTASAPGGWSGV